MPLPSGLSVAMMFIRFRVVALLTVIGLGGLAAQSSEPTRQAPRFWNYRELAEWATPIAALDVRPSQFSEREYYAAPAAEWVRTYSVYFPGREPEGYCEMLRARKPEPLIAPGARTEAAWIDGLALGVPDCSGCHTRVLPDGSLLNGAPFNVPLNGVTGELVMRGTPSFFPGDSLAIANWPEFDVLTQCGIATAVRGHCRSLHHRQPNSDAVV